MMHLCVTYIKRRHTSKQASEWQNVSDSCATTDLHTRGAKEGHNGYQQHLNHVTCVTYTNPQSTSKEVSGQMPATVVLEQICVLEMLKTSEEHGGYQQRFNHQRKLVDASVYLLLQEPFLTLRFLIVCV